MPTTMYFIHIFDDTGIYGGAFTTLEGLKDATRKHLQSHLDFEPENLTPAKQLLLNKVRTLLAQDKVGEALELWYSEQSEETVEVWSIPVDEYIEHVGDIEGW